MTFHAVVPAPRTILKGVAKLPPATVAVIEADGARRERKYWGPVYGTPDDARDLAAEDWQDRVLDALRLAVKRRRSEEHTSELQSLMRTSYAVFFLKKKNK